MAADAPQGVLVAATMLVLYRFNLFALTELNDNDMSRFLAKVEQGYVSSRPCDMCDPDAYVGAYCVTYV